MCVVCKKEIGSVMMNPHTISVMNVMTNGTVIQRDQSTLSVTLKEMEESKLEHYSFSLSFVLRQAIMCVLQES